MNNISLKIVIEGKTLSDGNNRVYLRIIKNRKKKNISLGLKCKPENLVNEQFTKKHPDYKSDNELLLKMRSKANQIVRKLQINQEEFSLEEFEKEFRGKRNQHVSVSDFFDEIIDEMNRSGRTGNAKAYLDTKKSILKFATAKLTFKEINSTFLDKYEVFLRENGNQNSGIAFKMRELRALYNKAIKRDLANKEFYPFQTYKISKLKSKTSKRSITVDEFKRIKELDLKENAHLVEALNYFLFSIYTRGMNFMDMMLLKWSDIQDERIYYTRSKTKGQFNIDINIKVREILDYYKSQNRSSKYVFPILLKDDLTPVQIFNRKHKVLGRYNGKNGQIDHQDSE